MTCVAFSTGYAVDLSLVATQRCLCVFYVTFVTEFIGLCHINSRICPKNKLFNTPGALFNPVVDFRVNLISVTHCYEGALLLEC